MAIALTPFEGLCGFRPANEIVSFLQTIPEFYNVVGEEYAESFITSSKAISTEDENSILASQKALKSCFTSVMQRDQDFIKRQLDTLLQRMSNTSEDG